MKKHTCLLFFLFITLIGFSQVRRKGKIMPIPSSGIGSPRPDSMRRSMQSINSYGEYQAFSTPSAFRISSLASPLSIGNTNVPSVQSGQTTLLSAPKGTYGFANGKFILYSNGSASSGTATGSGSVGTGTSPGSIGSWGRAFMVNGKSSYEDQGPYGSRLIYQSFTDSSAQRKRN